VWRLEPKDDRMADIRSTDAFAEAKKAEGARCIALLIPSPPSRTGKESWDHWIPSRATLRTAERLDLSDTI